MKIPAPEKHPDLARAHALDASACRAREIVDSLRRNEETDVFDAFWQLDALPINDVHDALAPWTGPPPDLDRLDTATRLAYGLPIRPLRLRTLSVAKDADILDLGPVAEEQLRLAGKSWDGADLAAEERLDGELEGSLAGTLERRVLADAEAAGDTPLFDVLLFDEDAGVVFAAGTTNVVALIAYLKVEMRDRRTRVAIEEALAARGAFSPVQAVPAASVVAAVAEGEEETGGAAPSEEREVIREKTAAKKTVKKGAAKKGVVKTAAKGVVAKKTVVKKTAKKTVAKTAKKAVAKAAKKAVAKKAVAKKTAKKAVAKKIVKKRAGAERGAAKTAKRAIVRKKKVR